MAKDTVFVESLLAPEERNIEILSRIEILVFGSVMLFLVMFILDAFRVCFHSSIGKAILNGVDSVSDSIVIYVLGVMQTAPFKNQLFPVWAIVLVGFRHNIDFISGYGVPDKDRRRFIEWRNVVKYLGVAFLNKTRGSMFAYPLWSLWCLQVLRSLYRLNTWNMAVTSVWHGKSSQLISEYMRTDAQCQNFKLDECIAETMEGYKYLVYGEIKKNILLKKPRYVLQIANPKPKQKQTRVKVKATRAPAQAQDQAQKKTVTGPGKAFPDSVITLDKIWQCDGALLHADSTHGNKFKDLSLAFSLSRLLRCKLEDVTLHKDSIPITKNLVMLRIIKEEAQRAFGVMEMEMSFLNDYFNTRYPIVFWAGFHSIHFSSILSGATFAIACWLSVDIRRVLRTPKDEVAHVKHGYNIDMIITWVFMFFMMFREIWEMVSYYLSDWARLLLASSYVRLSGWYVRNHYMEDFIGSFFKSKIVHKRWHGVLDQYAFLQAYDDSPKAWNGLSYLSTGALPKKEDGKKLSESIDIPECVKSAILVTLRSLVVDPARPYLLDVIPSLLDESREQYRWACFKLPTSSHIILVWHIATSLCEIRFAQDRDINLSNPGFPLNILLYLTSFCRCCCCAPQPYLVNENILDGDLKTRYTVANSLSRYCAYLLVSKPDLLPDSFYVPNMIFEQTVKDARRILKNSDSLDKSYKILIDQDDILSPATSNSIEDMNIVQQGAKLANELMRESEEACWEILAGVWADILVHTAPTWNAGAHKSCLESGGEFITHIWALLWHCGIEKSNLWPVGGFPKNTDPGTPQSNSAENNSAQPQVQAATAMERDVKQGMVISVATADGESFANGNGHLVRGMPNPGNRCYFNAVLQSLLAFSHLRLKMLEQNSPVESLHLEMKQLFKEAAGGASGAGGMLVTENLFTIMNRRYEDFKPGVVEDSNNLLGSLLEGLCKEEPILESLFRGLVAIHRSCKQCEHDSVTTQVLDLSLAIPLKENVSVEECLDLYATEEVDGWRCTSCSAATVATGNASSDKKDTIVDEDQTQSYSSHSARHPEKQASHSAKQQTSTPGQNNGKLSMLDGDAHQMEQIPNERKQEEIIHRAAKVNFRITKAPPLLTIQLKRFRRESGSSYKLQQHVSFQEILNIRKFMDPRCAATDDYKYYLVAVIVHEGPNLDGGHNYCYVRGNNVVQQNGVTLTHTWFHVNDEKVKKVSLEEVLKCQAYILFYEDMPPPAAVPAIVDHDVVFPARLEYAECYMPLVGDDSASRRFAFAIIDPPPASPGLILHRALEERGGSPDVLLAASYYGAMMVVFQSQEAREASMRLFPFSFEGHDLSFSLERPEEADNRFAPEYSSFTQISATGFPLEHWNEADIRHAFRSIGDVCCVDPLCLNERDFSAVRLVLKVEDERSVPFVLLLRDFKGTTSTKVTLHVVRSWSMEEDGSSISSCHFHGHGQSSSCSRRASSGTDSQSLSPLGSVQPSGLGSTPTHLHNRLPGYMAAHQQGHDTIPPAATIVEPEAVSATLEEDAMAQPSDGSQEQVTVLTFRTLGADDKEHQDVTRKC